MKRRQIADGAGPGLFLPWPDWMLEWNFTEGPVEIGNWPRVVDPELWHREPVLPFSVRLTPEGPDIARCASFDAASRVAQEARGWDFAGEDEPVYIVGQEGGVTFEPGRRWVEVLIIRRCWWVASPPADSGSVSYSWRYMELADYLHRKWAGLPV